MINKELETEKEKLLAQKYEQEQENQSILREKDEQIDSLQKCAQSALDLMTAAN